MSDLPLHPALVHVPIGLAALLPLLALGLGWAIHHRQALPRKAWIVVVGVLAIMLAGCLASMNTGEDEEDRVESVVPEAVIEEHEERAEAFTWAVGICLAVALGSLVVPSGRLSHVLAAVTILGSLVVAGLSYRVGHAGGTIVHRHMVQPSLQAPGGGPVPAARDDDD